MITVQINYSFTYSKLQKGHEIIWWGFSTFQKLNLGLFEKNRSPRYEVICCTDQTPIKWGVATLNNNFLNEKNFALGPKSLFKPLKEVCLLIKKSIKIEPIIIEGLTFTVK